MKLPSTSKELSKSLRAATLWPLIFVGVAIAISFSAVLLRQHQERSQELRALFHRTVEAQKQFFIQELLLARSEAILLRLEHVVNEWQKEYPDTLPCIELHQFGAGLSLPKLSRCAFDGASSRTVVPDEIVLSAGDSPLGTLVFWQQSPLSLTLSGLRILSAVFVLLFILAVVAHIVLVKRVEKRVLWPLVDRLVEERRKAEVVDVVRMLAHDIRRPFQLLQSAVRAIPVERLGGSKELMARILNDVEESALGVNAMLEDVLDTHREVSLTNTEVLLLPYLHSIAREAEVVRLEQGMPAIEVEADAAAIASFDAKKVRRVMANLLENAVEYAGASGRIAIQAKRTNLATNDILEISVWNDGPAISADDMTRLFVQSFSRRKGGTGLGLISAKRIIEAHGGTIRCESEDGKGTKFVVAMPQTAENVAALPTETIVAFDDDASVRALFSFEEQNSLSKARIHVFADWESFVQNDDFDLLVDATVIIDMNYRGSKFQGDDIARHASRMGARRLVAFTSDPAAATSAGVFDDVIEKSRFDLVRRLLSFCPSVREASSTDKIPQGK